MSLHFNDSLTKIRGFHLFPWKISEIYLKPLMRLTGGRTYKVIFFPNKKELFFDTSYRRTPFQNTLVVTAYLASVVIFPLLTASFVVGAGVPLIAASCILGLTPIMLALGVRGFYRSIYKCVDYQDHQRAEDNRRYQQQIAEAQAERERQAGPQVRAWNEEFVRQPQRREQSAPAQVAAPRMPQTRIEAQKAEQLSHITSFKPVQTPNILSNYDQIVQELGEKVDREEYNEFFHCPLSFDLFDRENIPVFLLEDQGHLLTEKAAADWKEANGDEPKDIYGKRLTSFNYTLNSGHLSQMRYDKQTEEVFWEEPMSGKKLGEPGFTQPYFCPLDGLTYDLETFQNYINSQINENLDNNIVEFTITSPANPNIEFSSDNLELYPNFALYKFMQKSDPSSALPKYEKMKMIW